jgi:hypothetical protein
MSSRFVVAVLTLSVTAACSDRVDVEDVPVGTEVQVTRQDGGVVEGTLAERDEKTVKVAAGRGKVARTVTREEIADLQVVTPERPVELPPLAKFREHLIPEGTPLQLTLETAVSSETSRVEDPVEARLAESVRVDNVEVLPAGSVVHGTVRSAQPSGKVKGRASLALHFDAIVARGERYPISATIAAQAESRRREDAATIGLGAAGGAIIGGILGGGKGAATGAAVGGGAGTAVVLVTEGKPIEWDRGAPLEVTLAEATEVRVPVR